MNREWRMLSGTERTSGAAHTTKRSSGASSMQRPRRGRAAAGRGTGVRRSPTGAASRSSVPGSVNELTSSPRDVIDRQLVDEPAADEVHPPVADVPDERLGLEQQQHVEGDEHLRTSAGEREQILRRAGEARPRSARGPGGGAPAWGCRRNRCRTSSFRSRWLRTSSRASRAPARPSSAPRGASATASRPRRGTGAPIWSRLAGDSDRRPAGTRWS